MVSTDELIREYTKTVSEGYAAVFAGCGSQLVLRQVKYESFHVSSIKSIQITRERGYTYVT